MLENPRIRSRKLIIDGVDESAEDYREFNAFPMQNTMEHNSNSLPNTIPSAHYRYIALTKSGMHLRIHSYGVVE